MENNTEQNNNVGDNSEPNVYIFGKEVSGEHTENKQEKKYKNKVWSEKYHCHHHYHHQHYGGSGIFALLIIFSGIVLLLGNMGLVSPLFWNFVIPFWPVLLILVGIKLILGRNWFSSFITFIIAFAVIGGIFVYGLIKVNSSVIYRLPPEIPNFINNI